MPEEIIANNGNIRYIYSADGAKLASVAGGSFTYYRSTMVYGGTAGTDEQLLYVMHPEGVVVKHAADNGFDWQYHLTDYMGNVRTVALADVNGFVPVQSTDYYAFGLAHGYENLHLNRYLFSGKELQDANVGDLGFLGLYDYGARFYDPILGRWHNIDPALQTTNPYLFCGNAPMVYVDKDGQWFFLAAMVIGGIANWALNGAHFNGDGLLDFSIGAISGAIGGATGAAVSGLVAGAFSSVATTASQFATQGMIAGAAGGFAGGFASGAASTWMSGGSFGDGMLSGLVAGGMGGLSGGIAGGIGGVRQFNALEKAFVAREAPAGVTSADGGLIRSDATLKSYSEAYFSDAKYYKNASHVYDNGFFTAKGSSAYAETIRPSVDGVYTVRYADKAFNSKLTLWLTMGHEYVHVSQLASGLPYNRLAEGAALQWEKNALANSKLKDTSAYRFASEMFEAQSKGNNGFLGSMQPYLAKPAYGLPTTIPAIVR